MVVLCSVLRRLSKIGCQSCLLVQTHSDNFRRIKGKFFSFQSDKLFFRIKSSKQTKLYSPQLGGRGSLRRCPLMRCSATTLVSGQNFLLEISHLRVRFHCSQNGKTMSKTAPQFVAIFLSFSPSLSLFLSLSLPLSLSLRISLSSLPLFRQDRGPSAAARQARGPSAAARQARGERRG